MNIIAISTIPTTTHDGVKCYIPEGARLTITKAGKLRSEVKITRRDGKFTVKTETTTSTPESVKRFIDYRF